MPPSTTNLIAAAAVGYQREQLEAFMLSALQNTQARIALVIQNTDKELLSWLRGHPRITLFTAKPEAEATHAAVTRFQRFLAIAEKTTANQILLTDARDVFFQSDPFIGHTSDSNPESNTDKSLLFAAEPRLIQNCPINQDWIQRFFTDHTLTCIQEQPVLCIGTVMGTRNSIVSFLRLFTAFINDLIRARGGIHWGLDQAALNVLVHTGQLTQAFSIQTHTDGPFLTLYHQQRFLLDAAGHLLCENGSIAPIVHQYDRYHWLSALLQSSLLQQTSRL